jgi:hypothetical protein
MGTSSHGNRRASAAPFGLCAGQTRSVLSVARGSHGCPLGCPLARRFVAQATMSAPRSHRGFRGRSRRRPASRAARALARAWSRDRSHRHSRHRGTAATTICKGATTRMRWTPKQRRTNAGQPWKYPAMHRVRFECAMRTEPRAYADGCEVRVLVHGSGLRLAFGTRQTRPAKP